MAHCFRSIPHALLLSLSLGSASLSAAAEAPWVPDLGNGTYKNPVLYADYSDPDAIRVGEDFYLVSSSFSHVPGLPVLHSRDLVNWTLIAHALPTLVPKDHFSTHRPGQGVWAPALRHHAGKFWIYYPDPDFGIYLVTAEKPEGPWSEPILVKAGKGLIDPCPFWDNDGKGYLVHGWAASRSGISNRLTIVRLNEDGTRFADDGRTVVEGAEIEGWTTIEGPKLYKRNGYYYIFAPAGGVKQGWQAVFRSKEIYGPYENHIAMDQGPTPINGPHQGAWVSTSGGQDWFLHFQDQEAYGRVVHLQPMVWKNDWPVIGEDPDGDGKGQPVLTHAKPDVKPGPILVPATTDEFDGPALALSWQWQANPKPGWASLAATHGKLRLACVMADKNLYRAPNLLLQKFPAPTFEVTTELKLVPGAQGDQAGLVVFGYDYAWVGLRRTSEGIKVISVVHRDAAKDGRAVDTVLSAAQENQPAWMRVRVGDGGKCQFFYSLDGKKFTEVSGDFTATVARWVGAKVGLFATASATEIKGGAGHADISWFRVTAAEKSPR